MSVRALDLYSPSLAEMLSDLVKDNLFGVIVLLIILVILSILIVGSVIINKEFKQYKYKDNKKNNDKYKY